MQCSLKKTLIVLPIQSGTNIYKCGGSYASSLQDSYSAPKTEAKKIGSTDKQKNRNMDGLQTRPDTPPAEWNQTPGFLLAPSVTHMHTHTAETAHAVTPSPHSARVPCEKGIDGLQSLRPSGTLCPRTPQEVQFPFGESHIRTHSRPKRTLSSLPSTAPVAVALRWKDGAAAARLKGLLLWRDFLL